MYSGQARAQCAEWDADFSAGPTTNLESVSLDFSWDQVVANCATFTYDHYEICWNKGPSSSPPGVPATPSAADECIDVSSPSTTSKSYLVHRADRAWDAAIFACDDAGCGTDQRG